MTINLLKRSLIDAPIVKKKGYSYVINPITDGIPEIKPELLDEVTREMENLIQRMGKIDKIVTIEAMGIPLASILSIRMNIPFVIIRKRSYELTDEISVQQVTGYSKSKLFINGLKKGNRIIIVDDVISTGGTLRALLNALENIGVTIKGVVVAVNKGNAVNDIKKEFNLDIKTLVNINIVEDKIKILDI